jgi:hypothetical protein
LGQVKKTGVFFTIYLSHYNSCDAKEEIAQLRIIARDAAITAELWLRSKHGTWRFFLVTPSALVEIDRGGNRLVSGQTLV